LSKLKQKLIDIKKNKQIPILVGGSGLYLNAAINGLAPIPVISQNIKDRSLLILNEIGIDKFRDLIYEIDPIFSNKINDKHRLLRAHSVFLQTNKNLTFWHSQKREGMVSNTISSFLMSVNRDLLYKNCDARFNQMLVNGGLAEVEEIRNKNINRSLPIMKSLGVKWLLSYLDGQLNYEDAVRFSMRDTRNYAKRQLTWFRHNYIPKKIINL
jgi:tRNA dimethylallyltransferase